MYIIIIFYNIIFYYISKFFYIPQGCHTENLAKISLSLAFSLSRSTLLPLFFKVNCKFTSYRKLVRQQFMSSDGHFHGDCFSILAQSQPRPSSVLAPS